MLNECVRKEEMNLRVRWYRGQILKRLGHERRALEDFRAIVERDPRNVDAQRELRLHDMQRWGAVEHEAPNSSKTSGAGASSDCAAPEHRRRLLPKRAVFSANSSRSDARRSGRLRERPSAGRSSMTSQ